MCLFQALARKVGAIRVKQSVVVEPMGFQKGENGGAHRTKGSRNRIQADVIEAFAEHWEKHGRDAIDIVFKEQPSQYLRFAANFLPKEVIADAKPPEAEIPDDDFRDMIDKLRALPAPDSDGSH
jgi:hypothetical protein